MTANLNVLAIGVLRISTILLGAVPATALAFLALALGILSESSDSTRLLLLSPLGGIGALALWIAGFGQLPVNFRTAVGLTCGIVAMINYAFDSVQIDAMFIIFLLGPFLWLINPWILCGAAVIGVGHLLAAIFGKLIPGVGRRLRTGSE